jgi:putative ABC transport system permease protein
VLGFVFAVIAWAAALGCAASLIGALMANIDRKRKDLALLRLFGYGRQSMLGYVVLQALVLTMVGYLFGCGMYFVGSYAFNEVLTTNLARGTFVCRLELIHFVTGLLSATGISILVCAVGGLLATKIEPAESLRDV